MSLFDTLNFFLNFSIKGLLLMRDIWQSGLGWDNKLEAKIQKSWLNWLKDLKILSKISMPTCFIPNIFKIENIHLQLFFDSSAKVYSAFAYIRAKLERIIYISFLTAKSGVPEHQLQYLDMSCRQPYWQVDYLNLLMKIIPLNLVLLISGLEDCVELIRSFL